jgi:hypothetical protein
MAARRAMPAFGWIEMAAGLEQIKFRGCDHPQTNPRSAMTFVGGSEHGSLEVYGFEFGQLFYR